MEKLEHLYTTGGNVKWCSGFGKAPGSFLKGEIELPYDSAVPLKTIHSRELKIYVHTKTYAQMFIGALLLIVKK